jgi:GT2 family glycosyltransferase
VTIRIGLNNYSDEPPIVSIVIVNYNSANYLKKCIKSLKKQSFHNFEVLIIDNSPQDGSINNLSLPDERFTIMPQTKNLGFAAANNLGAKHARGRWLLTLNPDAFPPTDWVEQLLAASLRHHEPVMVSSTLLSAENRRLIDGMGDVYSIAGFAWRGGHRHVFKGSPPEAEVFGPCAAAAMYDLKTFRDCGGFDEDFFCFFEDVDLAFRMRSRGGICVHVPEAIAFHVDGASLINDSGFADYHGARNRVWCFIKNMPLTLFILMAPFHLGITAMVLVKAACYGRFSATWRGFWDGIKGFRRFWRKRKFVLSGSKISCAKLMRSFCWSPLKMATRGIHHRPLN